MKSMGRAAGNAMKDKRQAEASDSSDDSDVALEVRKKSKSFERELLREKENERKLKRELAEVKAKNKAARAQIVQARNDFPVFIVNEPAKYHVNILLT